MAFSFMQIISFIYLLVTSPCIASLLSHHKECLALFEFKQSFLHQPYASFNVGKLQKLDSWRKITSNTSNHEFDCCLWDGVECRNKGHVIRIDLSQSSLHGSMKSNSSLFNLVHLQILNLSMNNFVESQIPSEIARLKQLRRLDLSNSSFTGQIPIEISYLMQLTLLDLSWNPLKLQSPSFEELLQNLTSLEELHLSSVDISSFIPPFLSNFSNLRSIDLESCQLRDQFPSKIFHLPKLKLLNMANNPILMGSLPEFQNNTLLEHLDLYTTSFAGSIPESISKQNHLVYLSLGKCYFSGCIPFSLSNMTQLTALSLGQDEVRAMALSFPSHLSNPAGLEVCEKGGMHNWIAKLTNLELLSLVHITMYNEILPSFANLTKLSMVIVTGNHISGHIPSSFMNLTRLSLINFFETQLQGQISSLFSNFKSLKLFSLMHNNFSGRLDLDTFVGLTKLRYLYLDGNRLSFVTTKNHTSRENLPKFKGIGLSSCNLTKFPSFLRLQKKLKFLLLSNNKIGGLVPEWILNTTQETLLVLDLSYNSITGFHRHPNFLPWACLEVFDLGHNKLRGLPPAPPPTTHAYDVTHNYLIGEIPSWTCEVKYLRFLDLSSNYLTGILPPCLGNLSNLSVLDLKRNNFHGPMMDTFIHGNPMKKIDLSGNQLSGKLSKSLANCTDLEFLSLGGNLFEDVFPFWLGNLANLQVLILRSNKFFGTIQSLATVGSPFFKLRIIDLSCNEFSGHFPEKFFRTWNAMKSFGRSYFMLYMEPNSTFYVPYSMTFTNKGVKTEYPHILNIFTAIDLSCNNFEGLIPKSLYYLHGLQSINLSNNHLAGRILPSLGNLRNLESLDLSQNELVGEIPHELSQLGFLEVFNVSFNHLHGDIPQGKQLSTFENSSYMGNPELCGAPLSKKCEISTTPSIPRTNNKHKSFLIPSDKSDWVIMFLGVGGGFVVGIVLGNLLYVKYGDWFVESSRIRKHRWVKPIKNTRRN